MKEVGAGRCVITNRQRFRASSVTPPDCVNTREYYYETNGAARVAVGKSTLFNVLQEIIHSPGKTAAVEFANDKGGDDTPGEYFSC